VAMDLGGGAFYGGPPRPSSERQISPVKRAYVPTAATLSALPGLQLDRRLSDMTGSAHTPRSLSVLANAPGRSMRRMSTQRLVMNRRATAVPTSVGSPLNVPPIPTFASARLLPPASLGTIEPAAGDDAWGDSDDGDVVAPSSAIAAAAVRSAKPTVSPPKIAHVAHVARPQSAVDDAWDDDDDDGSDASAAQVPKPSLAAVLPRNSGASPVLPPTLASDPLHSVDDSWDDSDGDQPSAPHARSAPVGAFSLQPFVTQPARVGATPPTAQPLVAHPADDTWDDAGEEDAPAGAAQPSVPSVPHTTSAAVGASATVATHSLDDGGDDWDDAADDEDDSGFTEA